MLCSDCLIAALAENKGNAVNYGFLQESIWAAQN